MRPTADYVQLGLLGEAVDEAPVAVLVADEHGDYLAANATACRLFGYERAELVTLNVRDLVAETDVSAHYQTFVQDGAEVGRITGRRKDGTTFPFQYRASRTMIGVLTYYVSVGWAE